MRDLKARPHPSVAFPCIHSHVSIWAHKTLRLFAPWLLNGYCKHTALFVLFHFSFVSSEYFNSFFLLHLMKHGCVCVIFEQVAAICFMMLQLAASSALANFALMLLKHTESEEIDELGPREDMIMLTIKVTYLFITMRFF